MAELLGHVRDEPGDPRDREDRFAGARREPEADLEGAECEVDVRVLPGGTERFDDDGVGQVDRVGCELVQEVQQRRGARVGRGVDEAGDAGATAVGCDSRSARQAASRHASCRSTVVVVTISSIG